jgi:hypothetical protein
MLTENLDILQAVYCHYLVELTNFQLEQSGWFRGIFGVFMGQFVFKLKTRLG